MGSFGLPALAVHAPEQPDLMDQVGKITQLKSLMQAQQLQQGQLAMQPEMLKQQELENQQRAQLLQDQQTVKQVLGANQGDLGAALPQLAGKVSPQTYMSLAKAHIEVTKETADLTDKQLAIKKAKNDQFLGLIDQAKQLPPDQYAQQYPNIVAQAKQIDPDRAKVLDPSQPIPQGELDQLGMGLQLHSVIQSQEMKKREVAAQEQTAAAHVATAQNQATRLQLEAPKIAAETRTAQQKARLGPGGVAAAEAAGKIQGEMGAMGGTAAGAAAAPNPNLQPGQRDEAYLQTLGGNVQTTVKAIAEGRMPLPSGFALKSPYWQNMLSMVAKYDPSFDAVNYNARSKTRNDFTSGKSAAQVNALNTVIGHLDTLSQAADKLGNSWSPTWNSVANAFTTASGKPQVKNFEVTKNAVTDELTRVWRQSGGTEADIQSWEKQLNASGSPEQLHSAIAQIGELLHSKLDSMQNQVQQGMGTDEIKLLTPKSQQTLGKLSQKAGAPQAQAASSVTATGPNGHKIMVKDGRWVDAQTGAPIQ